VLPGSVGYRLYSPAGKFDCELGGYIVSIINKLRWDETAKCYHGNSRRAGRDGGDVCSGEPSGCHLFRKSVPVRNVTIT